MCLKKEKKTQEAVLVLLNLVQHAKVTGSSANQGKLAALRTWPILSRANASVL